MPSTTTQSRRSPARALVALNACLLVALGAVTFAPRATAQNEPPRSRGDYAVVGGEVTGSNTNGIYIVDAANREMIALLWDESRRQLNGIGYRDLTGDLYADPER